MHYPWVEDEQVGLKVFSDTDWAGCRRTRRSTSGGLILRGPHFIRSWAKTQATVALSSGEAELQGVVKASAEAIAVRGLGRDLGDTVSGGIPVFADASAALGMVARQGIGRIRHLDTRILWVQEASLRRGLTYEKIQGTLNPADPLTKYVGVEGLINMMNWTGMEWRDCPPAGVEAAEGSSR